MWLIRGQRGATRRQLSSPSRGVARPVAGPSVRLTPDNYDAATAAKKTTDLSLIRYRDGAADYLEVVTAQTEELTNEVMLIELQTRRLQSNIALVQALGGEADRPAAQTPLTQASRP